MRDAGHGHLQKIRDMVAKRFCECQSEALASTVLLRNVFVILEIRFDETQHEMRLPTTSSFSTIDETGHFPLIMIKATLTWCPEVRSAPITQELFIPPAALLECCTAQSLWSAIRARLHYGWDELAKHTPVLVLLMGHDSHSGNLRFIRGVIFAAADNVWVVSSRCGMHQLQRILRSSYIHSSHDYHNPLFCLCKLMHNGTYMVRLRKAMHDIINEPGRFKVDYGAASPISQEWSRPSLLVPLANPVPRESKRGACSTTVGLTCSYIFKLVSIMFTRVRISTGLLRFLRHHVFMTPSLFCHLRRFLDLMYVRAGVEYEDEAQEGDGVAASMQQRSQQSSRFRRFFNGDLQQRVVTHHCDLMCACIDEPDSRRRAHEEIDLLTLRCLPELASMQHWTKYQAPSRQLGLAIGTHGIFVDAFKRLAQLEEHDDECALQRAARGAPGASMPDQEEYRRRQRSRLKYAKSFVAPEGANLRQPLPRITQCLLTTWITDDLVRLFFKQSADALFQSFDYQSCLSDLANPDYSPANECVHRHIDAFAAVFDHREGEYDYWFLLKHMRGVHWESCRPTLAAVVLRQASAVWFRLVFHYTLYPYRLAAISDPRTDPEARSQEISNFIRRGLCCTGVAQQALRGVFKTHADFDRPQNRKLLQEVMRRIQTQTIPVERCFKQSKTHAATNFGSCQNLSTVSSNHILSSVSGSHNCAYASFQASTPTTHRAVAVPQRRVSGWNEFVGERGLVKQTIHASSTAWARQDAVTKALFSDRARRTSILRADEARNKKKHCRIARRNFSRRT